MRMRHTLVITTSYSGDTEETLAAFEQAQARLPSAVLTERPTERAKNKSCLSSASIINRRHCALG
jgi:glucose-6-phosphate isomerase